MWLSAAFKAANPNHPHVRNPRKPRRPRPISSGPKRGRPTRRVTDPTSRAAIRRSEERRGIRTTGPKPPTSRGPKRTTRTISTGPRRRRPTPGTAIFGSGKPGRRRRPTPGTAIARSRASSVGSLWGSTTGRGSKRRASAAGSATKSRARARRRSGLGRRNRRGGNR